MVEALTNFRIFAEQIVLALDYLGIAVVTAVTAPELVLPFAGFLIDRGLLTFTGVVVAGTAGGLLGHVGVYALARWVGEERLRAWIRRYGRWLLLREADLDRVVRQFERHNGWLLVVGRLIPTARSLIAVTAGIVRIPWWRYVVLTSVGVTIWNVFLVAVGAALGRNWGRLLDGLAVYENVVWFIVILLVLAYLFRRLQVVAMLQRGRG